MAGDSDKRIFDMQADVCLALANPKRSANTQSSERWGNVSGPDDRSYGC